MANLFYAGQKDYIDQLNTLWAQSNASLIGSSSTSLTIATGAQVITTQTGLGFVLGSFVVVANSADVKKYMIGQVTAYNTATGQLDINVVAIVGSGTYTAWVIAGSNAIYGGTLLGALDYATPLTVASAASTPIGIARSNIVYISGTTTITSFDTVAAGVTRICIFSGTPLLTNSANLDVIGSANIQTIAGDVAVFVSKGAGVWKMVDFMQYVGLPATKTQLAASTGSSLLGHIQSGTGAVPLTVQEELRERVSITQFGAVCDGSTDDSAAVQLAIDYCATFARWPTLIIPGRCRIASSVNIDRLVNTSLSDFIIRGEGPGAGFYTTGAVTIFDSTLTFTTDPISEFIRFQNLHFETSSIFNASYVISEKFLRCYFDGCRFALIRCQLTTAYVQTLYFTSCNIRNNPASFINCVGLYDVSFSHCIIENGSTLVRSIDASRGTNGLRCIDNVIEGLQSSVIVATGCAGLNYSFNHCESNFSPEINTFAGGLVNQSVTISGNYIYNPAGPTFYHGPTKRCISEGNLVTPSILHSNAVQVEFGSSADSCLTGGAIDSVVNSVQNGVTYFGTGNRVWTDSQDHLNKDASGNFSMGRPVVPVVRLAIGGSDQSSSNYSLICYDSVGAPGLVVQNDRQVLTPAIGSSAGTQLVLDSGGYIKTLVSSRRYKHDISPINIGLDFVNSLSPVQYKDIAGNDQVGFIAEDFPDSRLVNWAPTNRDDPTSELRIESVSYSQITAPLVKAIQELNDKFEAYKASHP